MKRSISSFANARTSASYGPIAFGARNGLSFERQTLWYGGSDSSGRMIGDPSGRLTM
ncbi:unannotated protein [freshwater metagenome]|uniref:Unannotated protein n=1 Tax=freshwater metagenome TaxID=449393 RepID=A0A6J7L6R8_9ZZZZ